MPAWIKYTLYRILVFAIILAVLLAIQVNPYIATFIAAILGLIISGLFFRKTRDQVALELATRRAKPKTSRRDDAEEDSLDIAE